MGLADFIFSSNSSITAIETIELSHTAFGRHHRFVGNSIEAISFLINNEQVDFFPVPMSITRTGTTDDLDLAYSVSIGDLGELMQTEIDNVLIANLWQEKPIAIYRVYRSDLLNSPIIGPITLECVDWKFDQRGANFIARLPRLNIVSTGEIYRIERFPMLAGFAND